ncbi:MAG: hypothetical protein RLY93_20595 [Sumerlaeia bacterium]
MPANPKDKPRTLQGVDDLLAAPYNPRRIKDGALLGLEASISRFGDIAGITWNRRTGHLVAGHQRVRALRELHGDGLTLDVAEGGEAAALVTPTGERFHVRVVDWDEDTEKVANVTANNSRIQGEFTDSLSGLLDEIAAADAESFEALQLDKLAEDYGGGPGEEGDELPEPPDEDGYREQFGVIVMCQDESEQHLVFERLKQEGYEVKVVTT